MAYQHGIYIEEKATQLASPVVSTSAIQFVVGTAPVNLLKEPLMAVNKLIVVNNFNEAKEKIGYSNAFDKFSVCQSVDASFRVFNVAPLVLVNVLDPSKHKTAVINEVYNITLKSLLIKEEGILIDDYFIVKNVADDTIYSKGTDYTIDFTADGYVRLKILPDGSIPNDTTELSLSYIQLDPLAVTEEDIIGGYNEDTGQYTGLALIEQMYPQLSLVPALINIPGWSHKPNVAEAMMNRTESISGVFKCECLLDVDTAEIKTYSEVTNWKNENGYINKHAIVLWPKVKINSKMYAQSAVYGAMVADLDYRNNEVPYISPSNKDYKISATVLEDGTEVFLDISKANVLNSNGIVTAIHFDGWKSWGNNTSIYPTTEDPKDRFIAIRRMFDWWGNTFILNYFSKVDDPMNKRLIETLIDSENIRANGFKARFQLAEAKISFNQDENSSVDLTNGRIKFSQSLTPYPPAESIINTLEFEPEALSLSLFGGE
jgi:hypothetical protein